MSIVGEGGRARPARGGPAAAGRRAAGNGRRSIVTSDRRRAGHVDALPEAHRGEEARRLLLGEAREQAPAWAARPGRGSCAGLRGRRASVAACIARHDGEQRQRASAGGIDERLELLVDRRLVARTPGIGHMGRAVEERVCPRSRTGCRRRIASNSSGGMPSRVGSVARQRRTGEHCGVLRPQSTSRAPRARRSVRPRARADSGDPSTHATRRSETRRRGCRRPRGQR